METEKYDSLTSTPKSSSVPQSQESTDVIQECTRINDQTNTLLDIQQKYQKAKAAIHAIPEDKLHEKMKIYHDFFLNMNEDERKNFASFRAEARSCFKKYLAALQQIFESKRTKVKQKRKLYMECIDVLPVGLGIEDFEKEILTLADLQKIIKQKKEKSFKKYIRKFEKRIKTMNSDQENDPDEIQRLAYIAVKILSAHSTPEEKEQEIATFLHFLQK